MHHICTHFLSSIPQHFIFVSRLIFCLLSDIFALWYCITAKTGVQYIPVIKSLQFSVFSLRKKDVIMFYYLIKSACSLPLSPKLHPIKKRVHRVHGMGIVFRSSVSEKLQNLFFRWHLPAPLSLFRNLHPNWKDYICKNVLFCFFFQNNICLLSLTKIAS